MCNDVNLYIRDLRSCRRSWRPYTESVWIWSLSIWVVGSLHWKFVKQHVMSTETSSMERCSMGLPGPTTVIWIGIAAPMSSVSRKFQCHRLFSNFVYKYGSSNQWKRDTIERRTYDDVVILFHLCPPCQHISQCTQDWCRMIEPRAWEHQSISILHIQVEAGQLLNSPSQGGTGMSAPEHWVGREGQALVTKKFIWPLKFSKISQVTWCKMTLASFVYFSLHPLSQYDLNIHIINQWCTVSWAGALSRHVFWYIVT